MTGSIKTAVFLQVSCLSRYQTAARSGCTPCRPPGGSGRAVVGLRELGQRKLAVILAFSAAGGVWAGAAGPWLRDAQLR
jgi:hypothetical protein